MTNQTFPLGRTMITPGARDVLTGPCVYRLLERHERGDWGDLDDDDRRANERALENGARIFSSYVLPGKLKIWIITEADRAYTTILLPDEY